MGSEVTEVQDSSPAAGLQQNIVANMQNVARPAPNPEPEPEPRMEMVSEPNALGRMAEFGIAKVLLWLDTVESLTEPQRAAIKDRLVEDKYIGQDLLDWNECNLPKELHGTGAVEAAPLLLAARDEHQWKAAMMSTSTNGRKR